MQVLHLPASLKDIDNGVVTHTIDIDNLHLLAIFAHQDISSREIQRKTTLLVHPRHERTDTARDLFAFWKLGVACYDAPGERQRRETAGIITVT